MEEVQVLKIGKKSYQIKDEKSRTTANTANKNATNALNKINNIKLNGTYTADSESLTLSISTESTD